MWSCLSWSVRLDSFVVVDAGAYREAIAAFAPGSVAIIFTPDDTHDEIATACLAPAGAFRRWLMAGGHLLAAGWLLKAWKELDANAGSGKEVGLQPDQGAIKEYYKQIWNLFYFEYAMYPFI